MHLSNLNLPEGTFGYEEYKSLPNSPNPVLEEVRLDYYKTIVLRVNFKIGDFFCSCNLTETFGSCGVCVASYLECPRECIKEAMGKVIEIAKTLGYSQLQYMATQQQERLTNEFLIMGFEHHPSTMFNNRRTNNDCSLYTFDLRK